MAANTLPTGNITDRFQSAVSAVVQSLNDFLVVNKTAGVLTVNIMISDGFNNVNINPLNMQLQPGTGYGDQGFEIPIGSTLLITTNGSLDYYIDLTPSS